MPMSGKEMLAHYLENGWEVTRQKGSHVRLEKGKARETIPLHKELKKGLERYLLKRLRNTK